MSKKLFALLLLLCSIAVSAKDVKTGDWNVIPLPQSVEVVAKPAFVINAHTTGYYTQDEARDIVRYAAERHITVIPEVDMPGHIQSALAAYPQLGCTGGPYDVCCHFGVIREVMCAGQPFALQLAKDVINEIMDIFPSPYIHIGGDECPKERWKE
jgi:N-acetyl-beta-hexosaminidase